MIKSNSNRDSGLKDRQNVSNKFCWTEIINTSSIIKKREHVPEVMDHKNYVFKISMLALQTFY